MKPLHILLIIRFFCIYIVDIMYIISQKQGFFEDFFLFWVKYCHNSLILELHSVINHPNKVCLYGSMTKNKSIKAFEQHKNKPYAVVLYQRALMKCKSLISNKGHSILSRRVSIMLLKCYQIRRLILLISYTIFFTRDGL